MLPIKLYFGCHLKIANRQVSCNIEKSAKNFTGIFRFFYVTAYSRVFIQQLKHLNNKMFKLHHWCRCASIIHCRQLYFFSAEWNVWRNVHGRMWRFGVDRRKWSEMLLTPHCQSRGWDFQKSHCQTWNLQQDRNV